MLLRFSVQNAFCFRDEVTLSLTASSDKQHPNHIKKIARPGAAAGLRAAGIYGANGHGKTKLVHAFMHLKFLVCGNVSEISDQMIAKPFRASKLSSKEPTRFVVNYRVAEVDYEYGIVIVGGEIEQEWLFETEFRQEVPLFTRERINSEKYVFEFGSKLKSSKSPNKKFAMEDYLEFLSTSLDSETSFICEASNKKVTRLHNAYNWFCETLQIVTTESRYGNLHQEAAKNAEFLEYLGSCLKSADTGIERLSFRTKKVSSDFFKTLNMEKNSHFQKDAEELKENERMVIGSPDGPLAILKRDEKGEFLWQELFTIHKGEEGEVEFELSEESSGTQRMLNLLPMLFEASKQDTVFVVDELDRKLHPLLAYEFVRRFLKETNGQLIFTTHTAHLLDLDLLRRDEIWIVQKDESGSSDLYSLQDFKVRPDLDIRKGYLLGRFGGVPVLKEVH